MPESWMGFAHQAVQAQVARRYKLVRNLQLVRLPPGLNVEQAIEQYKRQPGVLYAEPNYIIRLDATPNDPSYNQLWGLNNTGQSGGTVDADIDAPEAWDLSTGSSTVVVGVIDSGVLYTHPDLAANMFQNTPDCNSNLIDDDGNGFVDDCFGIDTANNDSNPIDDNSHGTHVAGTIGAVGNNSVGVVGVNWTVKIIACKFLKADGSGPSSDAIDCLEYLGDMKDAGVNIVATNNSWGGPGVEQALCDAIDAHRQKGILFVAAAGNETNDNDVNPNSPSNCFLPNLIAVASTTRFDGLSDFSNFGAQSVDLGAPGSEILSTVLFNTYGLKSGTSMASPHVAGAVALLKAQNPALDWRALKNRILASGDSIAALADTTVTGKRLNVHTAMTCSGQVINQRVEPTGGTVTVAAGAEVTLAQLHINCASPNGSVNVTVNPGGTIITLLDNGVAPDQASGDGIYTGSFTASPAGTYTLTFPNADVVTVEALPPPPNDNFAFAIVISSLPFTHSTNTVPATTEGSDPTPSCSFGFRDVSVWYRYTPPANGTVVADTVGSDYDTVLSVWTGSQGSLTEQACHDDISFPVNFQSKIELSLTGGTTYYFMVSGFFTGGSLVFNLKTPNANDNVANATVINALPFNDSVGTTTASTEGTDPTPSCGNGSKQKSVWYKYTAPTSGDVTADTFTSDYDTVLSAYTGSPGSFSEVACNDDSVGVQSQVNFGVTGGTTYHLMVSGFAGESGMLVFHMTGNLENPVPGITALFSPSSIPKTATNFKLTAMGTNFMPASVVRWNGSNRTTTYSGAGMLTATIPTSDIAGAGTAQVTVFNPTPGGGVSNQMPFPFNTTNNPLPTVATASASVASVAAGAVVLTVKGSDFVADSAVQWNGANCATRFVSASRLEALVPVRLLGRQRRGQVQVVNPEPGGGASNAVVVTLDPAAPGARPRRPAARAAPGDSRNLPRDE